MKKHLLTYELSEGKRSVIASDGYNGIIEIEHGIEDVAYYVTQGSTKVHKAMIRNAKDGRAYILISGKRHYLDTFIKTDI